jgi:uncharacterized membrane protein YphA (DoxX/SURF4 family)
MSPAARHAPTFIGLLGLCAAYIQGGLNKLLDFPGAMTEAELGLPLAAVTTILTILIILVELLGSLLILTGRMCWLGALALATFTLAATFIANRSWTLPPGPDRFISADTSREHPRLAEAFLLVFLRERRA